MSYAERARNAVAGIDPMGTLDRAAGGLIGPIGDTLAIAQAFADLSTGNTTPRSVASLTALLVHRPGPGVPHRVLGFAIGEQPKIPERRPKSSGFRGL